MKPWVFFGSVFTAVVLAVGAFQVVVFGVPWLGTKQIEHRTYSQVITRLVFDGDSSDLEVRGGFDEVVVTRTLRWHSDKPTYSETWEGTVLTVRPLGCDGVGTCDIDYSIALPAGTELDLRTSSGDIETSSMTGPQRISASSGDVEVLRSGGLVSVDTSSGDVGVDAETPADVAVRASSGDIGIRLTHGQYDASADADSGDVSVQVETDAASEHEVSARTSSGDIEITYR